MPEVLEGYNQRILNQLKPGKDDAFLLQQSLEDATNGFCIPPLWRSDFLSYVAGQAHRLIPRCVITQSSGKQRVIDKAANQSNLQMQTGSLYAVPLGQLSASAW